MNTLGYNEELQKAAQVATADTQGNEFWEEVQTRLDAVTDAQKALVEKRPADVTTN